MKQIVALATLASLALSGCSTIAPSPQDRPEGGSSLDVFGIALGACLNDVSIPLGSDVAEVPQVPCTEPHDSELYAILGLEGSVFPGEERIISEGQERCASAFGDFVGIPFANSTLEFRFYYPSASSWSQGDRSIYCVAFDPGLQTTGSLLDAQR